jgi:hypothetical protein
LAARRVNLCTNFENNLRLISRFKCIFQAPYCPLNPPLPQSKAEKIPVLNLINARAEQYRKSFLLAFFEIINK